MPKKQQRNAFWFYMKDLEPELRREGRVFPNGMADVVPIAHPRWKSLPPKEKERYEQMAKEFKARMRGAEGDKYRMDNQGQIIANRRDEKDELNKYFIRMAKEVRSGWGPGEGVLKESFFLVNIQTLCETEEGEFLPCEIALIEFSMHKGIIKHFHRFIDPGRIPLGYKYTCINNSELTHQIPVENFEKATGDYSWVWTQMKNFVNPNQEKTVYPPVYCRPSVYKETKYCLEWMHRMALDRGTCKLGKLLNLEMLLDDLYTHKGSKLGAAAAIDILSSTSYDFVPNHLCEFHTEKECKHCALGIIRRYTYSMLDELAMIYHFEMSPQHLPPRPEGSLSVTIIPPASNSIFPQPTVNRGQSTYSQLASKGRSQGDGTTFASRDYRFAHPQESDSEEESEDERAGYTSLRLPKSTTDLAGGAGVTSAWGQPGLGRGVTTGSVVQSAWGQPPAGPMGRGMARMNQVPGVPPSVPPHTQAAAAPAPNMVRPTTGVRAPAPASVRPPVIQPGGVRQPASRPPPGIPVGRGMPMAERLATPRQQAPPSVPASPRLAATGCGRGVLAAEMKVPVGRGYAPPSMLETLGGRMAGVSIAK